MKLILSSLERMLLRKFSLSCVQKSFWLIDTAKPVTRHITKLFKNILHLLQIVPHIKIHRSKMMVNSDGLVVSIGYQNYPYWLFLPSKTSTEEMMTKEISSKLPFDNDDDDDEDAN